MIVCTEECLCYYEYAMDDSVRGELLLPPFKQKLIKVQIAKVARWMICIIQPL